MARFLKLTRALLPNNSQLYRSNTIMLNIDHVVSIIECPASASYPEGCTGVTMTSRGEDGVSELYFVTEPVELIAKQLPI